jgi:hypothetical protein
MVTRTFKKYSPIIHHRSLKRCRILTFWNAKNDDLYICFDKILESLIFLVKNRDNLYIYLVINTIFYNIKIITQKVISILKYTFNVFCVFSDTSLYNS